MTNSDFINSVRADLRHDIAAARERAELVEAIEGSPLWNLLTTQWEQSEGCCTECGHVTENYDADNGDWCCDDCRREIVRGQLEDQRLDDNRRW